MLYHLEYYDDLLGRPITTNGRGQMTTPATAAARPGCIAVIVVADADDDPSCGLGPDLLARARKTVPVPVVVVLAERCFEDWIYASYETLQLPIKEYASGKRGANVISAAVSNEGSKYVKPVWQPRLTNRMDISLAMTRSESLRRLFLKLRTLVPLIVERR
jgi:hypothetical protein